MPYKNSENNQRRKKKDKKREKMERNGKYSTKNIRLKQNIAKKSKITK